MVILEDSRQQIRKHTNVHRYFKREGIAMDRSKLYVGDYMIAHDGRVVVDTKKDVMELAMDLNRDHERFRRECIRAQNAGIQLIVLTEEKLPPGGIVNWRPPEGITVKFSPVTMKKQMITMQEKYGVKFRFCGRDETGEKILHYLTKGARPDEL